MKIRALRLYLCLVIATACLGVGYFLAGYWQIVPILLGTFVIWAWMKKQSGAWSASSFLLVYTVLAAVGVLADLSTALMIIACGFALASWDLLRFEQSIVGNATCHTGTSLEKHHLRSLAVAMATGLLFTIMSLYIHLQLPFVVIVSLVLIALGGLTYGVQYIKKAKR
jgi:hypothetical protein